MLKFKSEKLTKEDELALMLLGGDCGSTLDDVDITDGLDQDEVDIIDDAFDWLDDEGTNGYIMPDGEGGIEVNQGNLGDTQWGDSRWGESEWNQWKKDNGYK